MPTHVPATAVLSAGVDWLTATSPRDYDPLPFTRFGEWLVRAQAAIGGQVRPERRLGYVGLGANHCFWGQRHDGVMVQLAGADAAEWWSVPVGMGAHVTRIDLQVTADVGRDLKWLALRHWREACRFRPARGRPAEPEILAHPRRGDTLYLGDRSSELHARCYDKHREQPGDYPVGAWRYEVEYKSAAAQVTAARLLDATPYLPRLAATVHEHFAEHGCRPLFSQQDAPLELLLPRSRTDDARARRWLRQQVRGTVQRLARKGLYEELLADLGFDLGGLPLDPVTPSRP